MSATPRRTMRPRAEISYKEPGQLKLSMLEADKDNDSDDAFEGSTKGKASQHKRKHSDVLSQSSPAPSQRRKTDKTGRLLFETSENSLFGIIATKASAIPMAVKEWWEQYDRDRATAVCKLTNMVLEAAGFKERFPASAFGSDDDMDVDDYLRQLVETCASGEAETSINCFTGNSKSHKKVQSQFSDFWDKFVYHAPESELRSMHENPFCPWLHAMSTSQLKILRLASTIVGLEIMNAIVGRANDTLDAMNNLERLYEAAKSKKETQKLARLEEQLEAKRSIRGDAEKALSSFFNSIVIHRHRDAAHEIRARCISSIGKVIIDYKSKFLENSFLKYIGWALYDKHADVRLAALECIDSFYSNGLENELEMFTERFRDRILEMRLDVTKQVAIQAIETLKTMATKELLKNDGPELVYSLITEADVDIRSAAADFIEASYISHDLELAFESASRVSDKGAKEDQKDSFVFKGIVELLGTVASEFQDLQPAVEVLIERVPVLENFTIACDVLLEDTGDDALEPEYKVTLARMMCGTLSLLAGNVEQEENSNRKKNPEQKKLKEACIVLSHNLAAIFGKFGTEKEMLPPLVGLLQHFNLDSFSAKDKVLKDIVDRVVEISKKSQDFDVMLACGQSLANLENSDYAMKATIQTRLKPLYESLNAELKKISEAVSKGGRISSLNELSLKRAAILSGHLDIFKISSDPKEYILSLMKDYVENEQYKNHEVGCHLVCLCLHYLLWRMETRREDEMHDILQARDSLLEFCNEVLRKGTSVNRKLSVQVAVAIADMQQVFGRYLQSEGNQDLEFPSDALQALGEFAESLLSNNMKDSEDLGESIRNIGVQDDQDPRSSLRVVAIAVLKGLIYQRDASESTLIDMLSTVTMHRPYSAKFHNELLKIANEQLIPQDRSDRVTFWLKAHQNMYMKLGQSVSSENSNVSSMGMALIDSVSVLRLDEEDTEKYIKDGLDWTLSDANGRSNFLEMLAIQIRFLSSLQARKMVRHLEEICRTGGLSFGQANQLERSLSKFHKGLTDRGDSNKQRGSPTGPASRDIFANDQDPEFSGSLANTPSHTQQSQLSEMISTADIEDSPSQPKRKSSQESRGSSKKSRA